MGFIFGLRMSAFIAKVNQVLPLLNQEEYLPCNGQLWKPLCGIMQAALIERPISGLEIIEAKAIG